MFEPLLLYHCWLTLELNEIPVCTQVSYEGKLFIFAIGFKALLTETTLAQCLTVGPSEIRVIV